MKYLSKAPIVFSAPKGGWPTDWEHECPECGEKYIKQPPVQLEVAESTDLQFYLEQATDELERTPDDVA